MENRPSPFEDSRPDELLEALNTFLRSVPVGKLSKTLRNLFLSHIYHEMDTPSVNLEENILYLQALFDFLDTLEKVPVRDSSSL